MARTIVLLTALLLSGCAREAAHGRPWVHKIHIHGNQ
jgi:hypothetical protein